MATVRPWRSVQWTSRPGIKLTMVQTSARCRYGGVFRHAHEPVEAAHGCSMPKVTGRDRVLRGGTVARGKLDIRHARLLSPGRIFMTDLGAGGSPILAGAGRAGPRGRRRAREPALPQGRCPRRRVHVCHAGKPATRFASMHGYRFLGVSSHFGGACPERASPPVYRRRRFGGVAEERRVQTEYRQNSAAISQARTASSSGGTTLDSATRIWHLHPLWMPKLVVRP